MTLAADAVADLLRPERLTAVVDIGANPITDDGAPPYKAMLTKRLCTLVGFEPQPDALEILNARKSDLETYLPYAVGDGSAGTLKVCRARGMSSLLDPDPRMLAMFPGFNEYGRVIAHIPVETRTLDSISEIPHLDMLKIDVQGAELAVFRNGSARLIDAVAIQSEVSFMPLYKNQPSFADIDRVLRPLGFVPHMYANLNKRMILPIHDANRPYAGVNQLLEADIVYVRDFTQPEKMSNEQLKHLAMIAHHCYGSYDLVGNCLHHLMARGAVAPDALGGYLGALRASAAA